MEIRTEKDLEYAILLMESKQAAEWPILKEQFITTCESIKPMNIVKASIKTLFNSPVNNQTFLSSSVGAIAGILSKSLLTGGSFNPIKWVMGSLLQFGVSNIISKNPDSVQSITEKVMSLFNKKDHPTTEN